MNPEKLTQLKAEIICNAGQLGNEKNHGLAMHVYVAAGFVDSVNRDYAVADVWLVDGLLQPSKLVDVAEFDMRPMGVI